MSEEDGPHPWKKLTLQEFKERHYDGVHYYPWFDDSTPERSAIYAIARTTVNPFFESPCLPWTQSRVDRDFVNLTPEKTGAPFLPEGVTMGAHPLQYKRIKCRSQRKCEKRGIYACPYYHGRDDERALALRIFFEWMEEHWFLIVSVAPNLPSAMSQILGAYVTRYILMHQTPPVACPLPSPPAVAVPPPPASPQPLPSLFSPPSPPTRTPMRTMAYPLPGGGPIRLAQYPGFSQWEIVQ